LHWIASRVAPRNDNDPTTKKPLSYNQAQICLNPANARLPPTPHRFVQSRRIFRIPAFTTVPAAPARRRLVAVPGGIYRPCCAYRLRQASSGQVGMSRGEKRLPGCPQAGRKEFVAALGRILAPGTPGQRFHSRVVFSGSTGRYRPYCARAYVG